SAGQGRRGRIIQWMADPFFNRHRRKIKRTDAFQTCNIHTDLRWIESSSMVRIDAATRAKIMLCGHGIELIAREPLPAGLVDNIAKTSRGHNGPSHCAIGTIAAPDIAQPICDPYGKPDCATMTG